MIWNPFLSKKVNRSEPLYAAIVAAARQAFFYRDWNVADTVEGRFEMVILHLALVVMRLKGEENALRQALVDRFCLDMDDNLRELGVSDIGVAKKVRSMAEAFQGRYVAYEAADNIAQMSQAITRNVYAGKPSTVELAVYALRAKAVLGDTNTNELIAGRPVFQ